MFKKFIILLLLTLFLSGCSDISHIGFSEVTTSENTADGEVPSDEPEAYRVHTFYAKDEEFILTCVFIGDEFFKSLADSGILNSGQVFAKEGAKAGNITELRFPLPTGDGEIGVLTALVNENPENIIILLGKNDIINSGAEVFADNYTALLTLIKTYRPDSLITVLSIPPADVETHVYNNEIISRYNLMLKSAVSGFRDGNIRFLNLDAELKNPQGRLKSLYAQSDGVSLTDAGMQAVLWAICNM